MASAEMSLQDACSAAPLIPTQVLIRI